METNTSFNCGIIINNIKIKTMKNLTVTTKENKEIKIRINETTGKVHGSDYKKLNDDNFEVYQEGDGFVDFTVGNNIIRKTFPTWLESGKANLAM